MAEELPELDDFAEYARLKKKGFIGIVPKNGRAPVRVKFDKKPIPGADCAHGSFTCQDGVIYIEGDELKKAHVKGLQTSFRDDGVFTVRVAMVGDSVDVEGSEFDEVHDQWVKMKKVLDRHPLTIPVQKRYDRVLKLMKASPPKIGEIRKALNVLEPEVARMKTRRGGRGKTSEESEIRTSNKGRISKVKHAWVRLGPQVRSQPMTRKVREDFLLMEKLVSSEEPDEKALVATFERLADFLALAKGKAVKARKGGDAKQQAARKLLIAWQKQVEPHLKQIIAGYVRAHDEGAAGAKKLIALAERLPVLLQGAEPDLAKAKKTFTFFLKARVEAEAARRAAE